MQKDEKFEMHFKAAVSPNPVHMGFSSQHVFACQNVTYDAVLRAEEQFKSGQAGIENAHALITLAKDVLALSLDKQV